MFNHWNSRLCQTKKISFNFNDNDIRQGRIYFINAYITTFIIIRMLLVYCTTKLLIATLFTLDTTTGRAGKLSIDFSLKSARGYVGFNHSLYSPPSPSILSPGTKSFVRNERRFLIFAWLHH